MKTNVSLACSLYQSAAATVRDVHGPRRASFMYLITFYSYLFIIFFLFIFFVFFSVSFVRLNIFFFFVFCTALYTQRVIMYSVYARACLLRLYIWRVSIQKACVLHFVFVPSAFSPLSIYVHICDFIESARTIILTCNHSFVTIFQQTTCVNSCTRSPSPF